MEQNKTRDTEIMSFAKVKKKQTKPSDHTSASRYINLHHGTICAALLQYGCSLSL